MKEEKKKYGNSADKPIDILSKTSYHKNRMGRVRKAICAPENTGGKLKMGKWQRSLYQPVLPLGKDGKRVTGSAEHIALSRKAAGEGMVLVKNENETLPLAKGTKVALFGKGTIDYVKGGGGSGDVTVAYIRNFYEGMKIKEAEGEVSLFHELPEFYEKNVKEQYAAGAVPGMTREPEVPDELVQKAKAYTDTAIITICRFSGEGWDRKCQINDEGYELFEDEKKQIELSASIFENGDFCLTNGEAAMVEKVKANFKNVIVVMNVGGMVDTSWFKDCKEIPAVLMAWQGGMEGGLAAADVVTGDVNPSGKLAMTFPYSTGQIPIYYNRRKSGRGHQGFYKDITSDPLYPFGHGLSYTEFKYGTVTPSATKVKRGDKLSAEVTVTNTGSRDGAETVHWFISDPYCSITRPVKELKHFEKQLIKAGETKTFRFDIDMERDFGFVNEDGKRFLEAGEYHILVQGQTIKIELID